MPFVVIREYKGRHVISEEFKNRETADAMARVKGGDVVEVGVLSLPKPEYLWSVYLKDGNVEKVRFGDEGEEEGLERRLITAPDIGTAVKVVYERQD